MKSDKELKKELKAKASLDPDTYYATDVLKKYGFTRKKCAKCAIHFWTVNKDQEVCGDSACSGGFRLFENNPSKHKMSYVEVWQKFSKMFDGFGYKPIDRYPVVARWNPTADFVMASIAAFQPYVISGEVEPPANRLVIPQFSIRFGDIENIGITASHQTGFVMIGQHMFVSPDEWDQDKVFEDIVKWLTEGLGLPFEEITFHEDAWAGGGNFGPCMEYFSRGVELGNQVYMMYEQTPGGVEDLKLKVLDMGMGMERNAWFSQATPTQHHAVYPEVMNYLMEKTGVETDEDLMKRFIPLSGDLNIDEVDDINVAWEGVAKKLDMPVAELKEKVLPLSGVISIADHTRTLLFALCDGALPSNTGGGYNLRILIRRALSFVDKFGWNLRLADVCQIHARELKEVFPELEDSLPEVSEILDFERKKYEASKKQAHNMIKKIIANGNGVSEDKLIELYDSHGISPHLIIDEAAKEGQTVEMPPNFFGKVSERHEATVQVHATKNDSNLDLGGVVETEALYFDDYSEVSFKGKVEKVIGAKVVLDKTGFYPTSGGQLHDVGTLGGIEVLNVFKQGPHIVHVLAEEPTFSDGEVVHGEIDFDWRKQLSQHHTATHVVNAAARELLGRHINQAGAKKTEEKAHLDVTHFDIISDEMLTQIEEKSNEMVKAGYEIKSMFLPRTEAEQKYGMAIYQGGAVPGKKLRIIDVGGIDIEACGGTHLNNTNEIGTIRILKSTKIQDGVVRITFTAGAKAEAHERAKGSLLSDVAEAFGVEESQVPGRAAELFSKWKKARKGAKKKKKLGPEAFELSVVEEFDGDALAKTAEVLSTQPEHALKTVTRFLKELEGFKVKNAELPDPEN